jgi:plastocyanin
MIRTDSRLHRVLAAVVATVATLAATSCRSGGGAAEVVGQGGYRPAAVVVISDKPAEFEPKVVVVKVGDTVEWLNTGGISHSVEFLGGNLPAGRGSSPIGLMEPHGTYSYTFTAPGTYSYGCRYHLISGMAGQIEVVTALSKAADNRH